MRVAALIVILSCSQALLAQEPACGDTSQDYRYGFSVGQIITPRELEATEKAAIDSLFKDIAQKRQRHGRLTEFYCRDGEKSLSTYRVSTSTRYDYEKLLFLRSDVSSTGKSASFLENLRLKIDANALQLWGLNNGTGIDLIRATPGLLVYREVRRTRRAQGGFTERQVVSELSFRNTVFTITEHIYINNNLFGWRLWQY